MDPTNLALSARRVLLSGVLGLVLLIPASVTAGPGSAASCAAASATHRVAVVVQHLDGATLSRCVAFTADTLTGEQALAGSHIQAGLLPSGGFGNAVCQLDNEPTSYPPSCWTGTGPFWALFVAHGGGWSYSSVGVSSIVLHDGDAVGFRYQSQSTHAPPSIAGDCPDPTPAPTAPPAPRRTPAATAIPTSAPTHGAPPTPPSPAGASSPTTPGSPPAVSSPSGGGGMASASGTPAATPSPGDAAATALASVSADPSLAASATTTGGGPPTGLVLAAVAALAFAALGGVALRRPPVDLRRPR